MDDASDGEWHEDRDLLCASSETFVGAGYRGSTIGLKRFEAMIASIEKRAMALEAKRQRRLGGPPAVSVT